MVFLEYVPISWRLWTRLVGVRVSQRDAGKMVERSKNVAGEGAFF